ncbi:protein arginine kinase activator [Clostridium sp. USBA 49]|jgi:protein arginine kinase activator|uniref:UvrB/UvrC motif-containing protein n=1 Tax=Clostridium TaxID=1485 RepID=UPI00099A1D4C|nr:MULTISPECIES: UvrB/UvrC motif-containing protein [Clostridium]SKA77973.1 protein arginine kinase activator [Clostridium sp. USBA 49]
MLCENCHKNEANVHFTQIINGEKQELNLCESCANKIQGISMENDFIFGPSFSFQNILSGLMDYMSPAVQINKVSEVSCKNCGTTFKDFKKNGLLGCSECYETFAQGLSPVIKRVQGNIEHTGKIPKKLGKGIIEKRRIIKLKEELQKAIANEEYEKAAEIRDMIKSLQKNEE